MMEVIGWTCSCATV